ncbi:hypothetical protein ACT4S2_17055 [Kocuria turfanensis]|uniref:hypothetical protein n=1 Tax=Kocuria turfanensis TaxID=388357 RepID=UPI004035C47C
MDRPDRDRGRGLRLAGGAVTTAAGVVALLAIWLLPPADPVEDRIAGWVGAFAALVALLHGVLLLVGWSNGRRMSLTRARWRYGYTPVALVLAAGTLWIATLLSDPRLMIGLSALFVGNAFFMLFAPDTDPQWATKVTPVQQRRWRRILGVLVVVTVVCAGAAVWALGAEAFGAAVMVTLVGVMALLFGALIAVQLFRLGRIRRTAHR